MFWYSIISIRMLLAQYIPLRPPPFLHKHKHSKNRVLQISRATKTDLHFTTEMSLIQLSSNQPANAAYKTLLRIPEALCATYSYGSAAARWGNAEIINRSQCFGSSGFSAEKGLRASVLKHNWFHLHNLFPPPAVGNTVWQSWVMCFRAAMGREFVPGVRDETPRGQEGRRNHGGDEVCG